MALLGTGRCCYLCRRQVRRFLPYRPGQAPSPVTRALEVIGSDTLNFECPACGCHDRERHLAMFFDRLGFWTRIAGADVLHFAPEARLAPRVEAAGPASYVQADLIASSPQMRSMDLTAMPLEDGSIDLLICNHVLEHVPDDRRAFSEVARVLRPGGRAVLQTPWSPILSLSFSDPSVTSEAMRHRLFGQEDHVRVYGLDLFTRIEEAGLVVHRHRHADTLADLDAAYYGVNPREELIVAEKR